MFTSREHTETREITPRRPEDVELNATMPRTPSAPGMRAAETIIPKGRRAILDIVTPSEEDVLGWCCFARERHSDEWHRVRNLDGKYVIPVPDTDIEVLGFHRFDEAPGKDENVWRIYARNDVRSGVGTDVCLRLVVRSAAREVVRSLPQRVSPMRARVDVGAPGKGKSDPTDRPPVPVLAVSGA